MVQSRFNFDVLEECVTIQYNLVIGFYVLAQMSSLFICESKVGGIGFKTYPVHEKNKKFHHVVDIRTHFSL